MEKALCDGLGGSVKRSADMADDFFVWAKSTESTSEVKYILVSDKEYGESHEILMSKATGLKVVTGTMKLHFVVPVGNNRVAVRDTSCNCRGCIEDVNTTACKG
ncbi:hypothetical protein MAR_027584 [Mya arenaria]|uniref:Uncharacterized protein n=1 Tax=Mya arenaria TaxID=6604 RepID=A0ABY7EWS2_MYAAR|nr:hypothetical protein MAR_027584 [Mya arenaria]